MFASLFVGAAVLTSAPFVIYVFAWVIAPRALRPEVFESLVFYVTLELLLGLIMFVGHLARLPFSWWPVTLQTIQLFFGFIYTSGIIIGFADSISLCIEACRAPNRP